MYKKINSLVKLGFKEAIAYRFHFYVSLITSPLQLLIYYFLWKAIFSYSGQEIIKGFTLDGMIAYYALNMIVAFFTWSNVDEWMESAVREGELITVLLKPFKVIYMYFFHIFGVSLLSIILETIPLFLIGVIFFGVKIAPIFFIIMFFISMILALVLSFLISYLVGMTVFWFNRITGIRRVKRVVIIFLSGGMLPLTFFPEIFQKISLYLPFQYMRFIPINIYLESYTYIKTFMLIGTKVDYMSYS